MGQDMLGDATQTAAVAYTFLEHLLELWGAEQDVMVGPREILLRWVIDLNSPHSGRSRRARSPIIDNSPSFLQGRILDPSCIDSYILGFRTPPPHDIREINQAARDYFSGLGYQVHPPCGSNSIFCMEHQGTTYSGTITLGDHPRAQILQLTITPVHYCPPQLPSGTTINI